MLAIDGFVQMLTYRSDEFFSCMLRTSKDTLKTVCFVVISNNINKRTNKHNNNLLLLDNLKHAVWLLNESAVVSEIINQSRKLVKATVDLIGQPTEVIQGT